MEYELLLLGLLSGSAMHGYQLNEVIETRFPRLAGLKPSTAYSGLERLAQRGLVTVTTERVGRRPERRVYALTEAGRERFLELLRQNLRSADLPGYPGEHGLLFARALPAAEVRDLLALRRDATAARLPELERLRDGHPAGSPGRLMADHALAHARTEINWLDEVLIS
jgi:DNA-binding PadR family transcriptional regulator